MLVVFDVAYEGSEAAAACVVARDFADEIAHAEHTRRFAAIPPYVPGRFYERELPCLLGVLERVRVPFEVAIVDGYVWLDEGQRPGLGAHLHAGLNGTVAVIGVAKNPFVGMRGAVPVLRGLSRRPLYVTAAGMDVAEAAERVRAMHGAHRLPTLLRRADRLCRDAILGRA